MKYTATLYNAASGHTTMRDLWLQIKALLIAGHRVTVEAKTETRSSPQNRLMWASLNDISRQVVWHGQKLSADEWKEVFSASMNRQKVVPGLEGGFVVIGSRTSRMTVGEMCELQTLIDAFGAQQGVKFTAQEDV